MDTIQLARLLLLKLPYEPNSQQVELIGALVRFCSSETPDNTIFLLSGYAGTGKTSLVGALVKALSEGGVPSVLLAPTGRAAKVFAEYAGHPAYTIHRKIYRPPQPGMPFGSVINNPHQSTVFIVDEASMIGINSEGGASLLDDLIHYVYSGINCRMILLGDTAQLPPVGCDQSPAMNPQELRSFGLRVVRAQLTRTVRQTDASGILFNATRLRRAMRTPVKGELPIPQLEIDRFNDISTISGEELPDLLSACYAEHGIDNTILVTRANWRATQFNLGIRSSILYYEEELCRDERLLVVKNNYFWNTPKKEIDFIANGDVARVTRVYGTETKYGFRFADVNLSFPYRDVELDCKIILDCLTSDAPALTADDSEMLLKEALNDPDLCDPATAVSTRMRKLRQDPYFNALQVKYAYAVTCHKAQGGQWRNVVVDMGGIAPEALTSLDFYRWLYTATTRATTELYYLNPPVSVYDAEHSLQEEA